MNVASGMPRGCSVFACVLVLGSAHSPAATAAGAHWSVQTPANGGSGSACTFAAPCDTVGKAVAVATDDDLIHIGPGFFAESVSAGTKRLHFLGSGSGTPTSFNPATDTFVDGSGSGLPAMRLDGGGSVIGLRLQGSNNPPSGSSGEGVFLSASGASPLPLVYSVTNVVASGGIDTGIDQEGLRVDDSGSTGRTIAATVTGSYLTSPENAAPVVLVEGQNVSTTFAATTIEPMAAGTAVTVKGGAEATFDQSQVLKTTASSSGVTVRDPSSQLHVNRSTLLAQLANALVVSNGATADVTDSLVALLSENDNPNSYDSAGLAADNQVGTTASLTARGTTFVARGLNVEAALAVVGCSGCNGASTASVQNSIMRATATGGSPADVDVLVDAGTTGSATFTGASSSFADLSTANGATATTPGSGANVLGDPLFTTEAGGDFTLQSASPLIDRGDPSLPTPDELDLAGNPRSLDGNLDCVVAPDMGAYEKTGLSTPCQPSAPDTTGPASPLDVAALATATDTTAPAITAVSVSPKRFRIDPRGEAAGKKRMAKKGTTFRYALSEAATVTFTVERASKGRKIDKRCERQTSKNREKRLCPRYTRVDSFVHRSSAGKNERKFSGKIGSRKLGPGPYRAALVATDPAGNVSKPKRVSFTVVRG